MEFYTMASVDLISAKLEAFEMRMPSPLQGVADYGQGPLQRGDRLRPPVRAIAACGHSHLQRGTRKGSRQRPALKG
ncbi:hypothetical protein GW17_00015619 [Ensete ventricosum]|nr:hypothetical protein GW17_00015619 [Ensete ventricosum]